MVSWTEFARTFLGRNRRANDVGLAFGNLAPRRSAGLPLGTFPGSNAADPQVSATAGGVVVLVAGKRPQVKKLDRESRYIRFRENASISVSKALTCSREGASA
jgi:hypothetical protein